MKIKNAFPSGIYEFYLWNQNLRLKQLGNQFSFPQNKNQVLILGCPREDTIVEPGASILRIELRDSVLDIRDIKNLKLKKHYSKLAKLVYNSLWGNY